MGDWNEPRPDWEDLQRRMEREAYDDDPHVEGHNFPVEEDDGVCEDTAEIDAQLEIAEQVMEDNKEVLEKLADWDNSLLEKVEEMEQAIEDDGLLPTATLDGGTLNKMAHHLVKMKKRSITHAQAKEMLLSDAKLLEEYRNLKRW